MVAKSDDNDITIATNSFINSIYKNGYWQVIVFFLIEFSIMYTGVFIAFSGSFTGADMKYACNVPDNHSTLQSVINECKAWNRTTNRTEACLHGYKFYSDKDFVRSSMKADFGLVCDRGFLDGISQSCIMAGFCIGGIVGPLLADKFGRRYVTFIGLSIAGILGIIQGLHNNIYLFISLSLMAGTMRELTMSSGFVYGLEFIPNSKQSLFGMFTQLLWASNVVVLGIMAYFIREWRYLQIIGSVPIMLTGLLVFIVPESPRWLIVNGKFKTLVNLVDKFANKTNTTNYNIAECHSLKNIYTKSRDKSLSLKSNVHYVPLDIFRSKILFFWTLILILSWIFIVLSYYSSTMLLIALPGSKYFTLIVTSGMEIPSIILTYFIIKRGRNLTLLCMNFIFAFSFITVGFLNKRFSNWILFLSVIGKGSVSSIFYIIVVTSIYIYPTSIRSFGTGLPSAIGKLFAVIIPYYLKLHDIYPWLPTLIIGVAGCFIGILNVLFPDWINRPLPETMNDLDSLKNSVGLHFRWSKTTVNNELES